MTRAVSSPCARAAASRKRVFRTYFVKWRTGEYVQPFVEVKTSRMLAENISKQVLLEKAGPGLAANIPPEALADDFVDPCLIRARVLSAADSRGKIYLLVDDLCFSAADSFARFCNATGFAAVVRTWTGGDGIGFTPALVVLASLRETRPPFPRPIRNSTLRSGRA